MWKQLVFMALSIVTVFAGMPTEALANHGLGGPFRPICPVGFVGPGCVAPARKAAIVGARAVGVAGRVVLRAGASAGRAAIRGAVFAGRAVGRAAVGAARVGAAAVRGTARIVGGFARGVGRLLFGRRFRH